MRKTFLFIFVVYTLLVVLVLPALPAYARAAWFVASLVASGHLYRVAVEPGDSFWTRVYVAIAAWVISVVVWPVMAFYRIRERVTR